MLPIRIKACSESDLRMLGDLAHNIQRVLPVTQADIDAAAALGEGWVVWKVIEVTDPIDNLRGGTQLVIKQNSITPGQNVRRVLIVSGPGGETVVIGPGPSPLLLPDAVADSLSYVKAFGGTEQRNLPDNYIERQFIYMMDGSYLLTDIVPTYDSHIEMDFQTTTVPSGSVYLLGGRTVTYGGIFFARGGADVCIVDAFGTEAADRYTSSVSLSNNTRYKFTFNNKVATLISGGTTLFTNTFTGENANGAALVINGLNNAGTPGGGAAGIYLYSFKVWNAQGELVMDLVPAVQKGTVPVVGFYDTVSKTFKTATAGTFAAGGEAVPTPTAPIPLVSNNGVLKARHQSGLPLGYTLLDYVETDGNSYIDTNLLLSNTSEFEITFQSADATLNTPVMGAISGGTSFTSTDNFCVTYTVASGLNAYSVYCNGAAGDANESWNAGDARDKLKHTVKYNGLNIAPTLDGVDMEQLVPTTLTTNTPTVTTWLFGRNNTGSGTKTQTGVRIYDFNVVGTAHFVPCKNASNVVGMYDLVNGVFYQNAGTGNFVAGNPVSDPVEIYTDGTVETINVHGKNLFDSTTKTTGYYISATGVITAEPNSAYSALIPVLPNTTYILSGYTESPTSNKRLHAYDKDGNWISQINYVPVSGPSEYSVYGITPANCRYIRISIINSDSYVQLERGSTATDYVPYYDGGTATAEMLLKVGDYQDVQSIIDGAVTRNVGVKVFDGTEDWTVGGANRYWLEISNMLIGSNYIRLCTHFKQNTVYANLADGEFFCGASTTRFNIRNDATPTMEQLKQWLADQYAAGTPVIVIYPLATPTTESVTGQTLQVTDGDNTLEITQASLNNLQLEAEYKKTV